MVQRFDRKRHVHHWEEGGCFERICVREIRNDMRENKMNSDEERLLALFKMKSEIKLGDAEKYLNVSRRTAVRKLNQLIKLGAVRRLGKGPSVVYHSL